MARSYPKAGPVARRHRIRYYRACMRILIVHHGSLPTDDRPTTGGALRAWHHGMALQGAGHAVHWLSRAQDGPGGFASPAELALRARALRPDRILCVQPEDAPALATVGVPLAVDLYAPRLIEAPFEGKLAQEAMQSLRALAAGDVFLVSNPRQRLQWLGVMALAGIDTRQEPTLTAPLVAPDGPRRRLPRQPLLVMGGATWPWQDPLPAVTAALAVLDALDAGRLQVFGTAAGLPEHPRLERMGAKTYAELLQAYAGATLALDWMSPNPERSIALGFRQVDYLGCGLPVLTAPGTALAEVLGDGGWVCDLADLPETLRGALQDSEALRRRGKAAKALAQHAFSREVASAPLLAWMAAPTAVGKAQGPLVEAAALAARAASAEARVEAAERGRAEAEVELTRKREEVARLTAQTQDLISTVGRQSRALDEVAGFKREAIALLGGQSEQARGSLREAERQNALLQADVQKKTAELQAMDELRGRLENDVENLRKEVLNLRNRGLLRRG